MINNAKANNNTNKFETKVKVFLKLFSLSLLDLDTVKDGTNDICDTYTAAQPTLNKEGKNIKFIIFISFESSPNT